jgi:hypothetical protein
LTGKQQARTPPKMTPVCEHCSPCLSVLKARLAALAEGSTPREALAADRDLLRRLHRPWPCRAEPIRQRQSALLQLLQRPDLTHRPPTQRRLSIDLFADQEGAPFAGGP